MKAILALLLALVSASTLAGGPKQFELVYSFTFNGRNVGNVTDRFQRNGNHYQLTSIAKPDGALAFLLPVLNLSSEGDLAGTQFIPQRYRQVRSNAPTKITEADFDWEKKVVTHQYKGRIEQIDLPEGTQDALSQLYTFTLAGKAPSRLEFTVSNGRKLINYQYQKLPAKRMATTLGSFETVEYRRILGKPDDNAISVWIAPAMHYLPLRIRVQEETGIFEQQLIRFSYQAT